MFGNITGGGSLSSKYDYNPTSYVEVVRKNLYNKTSSININYSIVIPYYKKEEIYI